MRISHLSTIAAVSLLAIGAVGVEHSSSNLAAASKADVVEPPVELPDHASSQKGVSSKAGPKGRLDAPIDGKDGKPHDGPWVETAAERDRKKEKGEGKTSSAAKTEMLDGDKMKGVHGKAIPNSNEGVMDDPSRVAPKEGTRGTEGGMSERTKDIKQYKDKIPETPKEARPLPHSEQEKIPGYEQVSELAHQKSGDSVLEVCLPSPFCYTC